MIENTEIDEQIFAAAESLSRKIFPLHRSITGEGINQAFEILAGSVPVNFFQFKTDEMVHDWKIPPSWHCSNCSITCVSSGEKIVSFTHPLRVASHSVPVNKLMSGQELKTNLVPSNKYPNNLMHRYCYYEDNWSISVSKSEFEKINDSSEYRVFIDSEKEDGELQVAESIISGKSEKKIFLLSHICHPAQFNDGLVGVLLNCYMYDYIKKYKESTYYNYHFLFMPETIGSIAYCSDKNRIKGAIFAIFSEMTALDQPLHIQDSSKESDYVNAIIRVAIRDLSLNAKFSPFLKVIRNDEKIFNSPGLDVPSASITRALGPGIKDHPFFGYHTDLDTVDAASMEALKEVIKLYQYIIDIVENDCHVLRLFDGIPMLSRHKLFVDPLVNRDMYNKLEAIVWLLEKNTKISEIALKLQLNFTDCLSLLQSWENAGLVSLSMDAH